MQTARGRVRRAALVAAAAAWLAGCREPSAPSPAPPPADQPLAWPTLDEAGLTALIATDEGALGLPEPLAVAPDGAVVYRRSKPRDPRAELYQLDAAGKTTTLATAAALLAIAPAGAASAPATAAAAPATADRGIETVELSDDGARLLVPLAGRLFAIERATASARELAIGPNADPQLSPDGKHVAFVRDGDLWVAALDGPAAPSRLTQHPADRDYATAEPAAAALDRHRGYWWSPDSQSIAFQRTDARAVETLYSVDPAHPELPPTTRKLPRAGTPNATVDLGIVSLHGGAPRWVSWEARYPYLARVIWPARGPLTVVVLNREQTQIAALAVDATATRPLVIDKDPAWINLADQPLTWLADGSGFLWMTERDGAWSLERYAPDGTAAGHVVTADIGLRRIAGIDGGYLVIEATTDPRELHVLRIPLAGGAPTALTSGGGVHHALAGHGVTVIASAERAGGRRTVVVRGDARSELPSLAEHATAPTSAPTTALETMTLDDHLQYTAVTRPRSFDPKVRYPVILRVDGEPDRNAVLDARDSYLRDQWYADAGFIVVRTDGRGTPGRDRAWQRAIAGDTLTIPMTDQIGALKRLGAQHPELDLGRVAIVGHGFGGYLATLGALIHPDAFAAAVAGSPITDWAQLPTAYSERYMKLPSTNPEGYRRTSAASYAEQLGRPLLLFPGPSTLGPTLTLLDSLAAAGKRADLAPQPADRDLAHQLAASKLALSFLRDHLGPPVRPAVMPAPRSEEDEEEEREHKRR